jgi:magnesium-transporting ATPase (P-type)
MGKTTNALKLVIHGHEHLFDLLARIDFTPERKKMSVVVRDT